MDRSLEGTEATLAKYTHLAKDEVWGSFAGRFEKYRIDRDVAEATLEYIGENAETLNVKPPVRRDFEEPVQFFARLAKFRGEPAVLELLNYVVTNRLYGTKNEHLGHEEGRAPAPLSEKAQRRREREAAKLAKRGGKPVEASKPETPAAPVIDRQTARIEAKNKAKAEKAGKAARKAKAQERAK